MHSGWPELKIEGALTNTSVILEQLTVIVLSTTAWVVEMFCGTVAVGRGKSERGIIDISTSDEQFRGLHFL